MTQVTLPARLSDAELFSLAGFRDVDAAADKTPYFTHLDSFAKAFGEMTEHGLDCLGLSRGSSVLDVGCGHGACAVPLARRIGPAGRIIGLDASSSMVSEARRRFAASGLPIEFHVGDAVSLPFDAASFDAARADRVFMFLEDPEKALSELVRVTRPGGRIVVTEGDLGTHAVPATDVPTARSVLAALCDRSPSGWIGRRLRGMFVSAGLRDVELKLIPLLSTSFAEWNHRLGVERFVSQSAESVEHQRTLAWLDELRTLDAQGQFTATTMLFMVAGTRQVT